MAHNPECGLDCVSAGAVRGQPADANQQTGRQHRSGDQSAEQAKHTPGPWRWTSEFRTRDNSITESLIGQDGYGILSCDGLQNSPRKPNARLIAAAPEMLEALKDAHRVLTSAGMSDAIDLDYIAEVISKAEGRDR